MPANVPFARAVNPITKSDWETVGVKPDKDVPAEQALDFALRKIKPLYGNENELKRFFGNSQREFLQLSIMS